MNDQISANTNIAASACQSGACDLPDSNISKINTKE